MAEVQKLVEGVISGHKIAVFSKSYCPYCRAAKTLLQTKYKGEDTEVLELDQRKDGGAIQQYLLEKTGQRTVPNIFINQKHIGGSSDLQDLEDDGKLAEIIAGSA